MSDFSPKVRRLLAGLGVLLAVVIVWDLRYFTGARRASPRPTHVASPMGSARVARAPDAESPAGPAKALPVSLPAGSRNPFLTAGEQFGKSAPHSTETTEKESAPVRLEGIAVSDGMRAALLGGEAVREGEWAGDIKVIRVEQDRVVLARRGQRWTVMLPPPGAPAPEVAP